MIRIEHLSIRFDSFQITDLSVSIEDEEFHCFLGPTGCGKTVILESIMGLRDPSEGRIWVGEREVGRLPAEKRDISYVPQDLALFPHLRVKENILYGIRARRLDPQGYEAHVQALIRVMRVEPLLERYPANLSGGEKKRVALLRALVPKPKLLLLDEPLAGLDPSIKTEVQQLLKTLHASFRPTVLCVTHDFEEAYFLGDRMTIFVDGRVEQAGEKDEVFLRPKSKKVAQFLGARNLYRGRILKADEFLQRLTMEVSGLRFTVPMGACGRPVTEREVLDLFIRPEEIMVIREGKPVKESLKRNILLARVVNIYDRRNYQAVSVLAVEGEMPMDISIPNYAFRNLDLSVGKIIRIAPREESFWVMG